MRGLWKVVKEKCKTGNGKKNAFLIINTAAWSAMAFVLALLIGLGLKPFGAEVLWNACLIACCAGVFPGFLGGCIFLMQNTTMHDWEKQKAQR